MSESRQRLLHCLEVAEGHQSARVADGQADQSVQSLIRLVLVHLEVTRRVERDDVTAASVGVNPERDLLRHDPARHECGGRFAEQAPRLHVRALRPRRRSPYISAVRSSAGRTSRSPKHVWDRPEAVSLEPAVTRGAKDTPLFVAERLGRGRDERRGIGGVLRRGHEAKHGMAGTGMSGAAVP